MPVPWKNDFAGELERKIVERLLVERAEESTSPFRYIDGFGEAVSLVNELVHDRGMSLHAAFNHVADIWANAMGYDPAHPIHDVTHKN